MNPWVKILLGLVVFGSILYVERRRIISFWRFQYHRAPTFLPPIAYRSVRGVCSWLVAFVVSAVVVALFQVFMGFLTPGTPL